jgi:threonine synthase
LTSANSINIARLIPQSFYYFYGLGQISEKDVPVIVSVPCGNFGNLSAGLMAKKMGLPVTKFVASVNQNDSFVNYLNTGIFKPVETIQTISNAMDVGNPSNFKRILDLYNYNVNNVRQDITSFRYTDDQTKEAIKSVYEQYGYIMDTHGAVGYLGLREYLNNQSSEAQGIFIETAHPAKFVDIVQPLIPQKIEIPERLANCMKKEKQAELLSKEYEEFKEYLVGIL